MRGTMLGRITGTECETTRRANRIKAVGWPQHRSPENWKEKEKNPDPASRPSPSILVIRVPVASSARKHGGASSET